MDRMGGPPAMGCHQPLNPISWFSVDLSKAQKRAGATVSEKNKSSLEKRKYQIGYGDGKPFFRTFATIVSASHSKEAVSATSSR